MASLQDLGRGIQIPALDIEQAQIEKQLPVAEPEVDRFLILAQFLLMLSGDSVRESQMVVRKRVVGIPSNHLDMTPDRLGVVFHSQEVVGERIADLIAGIALLRGLRGRRPLEGQRSQQQKPERIAFR